MTERLMALFSVAALVVVACGEEETTEPTVAPEDTEVCGPEHRALFESGKLTVATGETVFPPWMLHDDPESGEGFENGVVYAIAAELGFDEDDVVWTSTGFDAAIAPGDKPYDFNIQQYSITEERREVVDFSAPYYEEDKVLVTFPDSPGASPGSLADIVDLEYGTMIATTDLDYIENIIGATDVQVFDELADVFLAMEGGQVEATVVGLRSAISATAAQVPDAIIAAILPGGEGGASLGLLFAKGNELVPCVNEALTSLRAQGVLDALADEWLAGGGDIPTLTE